MVAIIKPEFNLREMELIDLPSVLQIEQENYHYPWTEGIFRDCIKAGYYCAVYEQDKQLVAYAIMSVATGESHILNVSVSPSVQRQGIGRFIVEKLLHIAQQGDAQITLLEVRPSNHAAINLYQSMGFERVIVRKDYYPDKKGREDAFVLVRSLINGVDFV